MTRKLLGVHIAFWMVVAAFCIAPMIQFNAASAIPWWLCAYLLYLGCFYVNLFYIFPRWIKTRKTGVLIGSYLILLVVVTMLILLLNKLFGYYQAGSTTFQIVKFLFHSGWLLSMLIPLGIAYRFTVDWFRTDQEKRELETQNLKTELAFLRSQMNPHFFLNTLNSIYVLAYQGSPKTAGTVLKLSEMMQYLLYESNAERVPLEKELDYIHQLIELQKLRIPGPMYLDFSVEGDIESYSIPSLLFIPFVENMLKYAVLTDAANSAVIKLKVEAGLLYFYTSNKKNFVTGNTEGIGINNIKRRLQLIFPDKHALIINDGPTHYMTDLTITLS